MVILGSAMRRMSCEFVALSIGSSSPDLLITRRRTITDGNAKNASALSDPKMLAIEKTSV